MLILNIQHLTPAETWSYGILLIYFLVLNIFVKYITILIF